MATQQETGRKFDRALGDLFLVEHTLYDSENGLNLRVGDVVQTECVNWVRRMGSCLGEIRGLPAKRKAEEIILVVDCVEDGGPPLGTRRDLSSRDPVSRLKNGEDPGDVSGDEEQPRARQFKRRGGKGGKDAA